MPLGVRYGKCKSKLRRVARLELLNWRIGEIIAGLTKARQEGCVMNKITLLVALTCLGFVTVGCSSDPRQEAFSGSNVLPIRGGVVNDETTALRVADAVISSVYGPEAVATRAYRLDARLQDGIWTVNTEPLQEHGRMSAGHTVQVQIKQSNGTVIRIAGNE